MGHMLTQPTFLDFSTMVVFSGKYTSWSSSRRRGIFISVWPWQSRCTANFNSGRQMSRVFTNHENETFLTMCTNMLTVPHWQKTSIGQPLTTTNRNELERKRETCRLLIIECRLKLRRVRSGSSSSLVIVSIQPEGRFWQEPEPSQATDMGLAHCILGSFFRGRLPLLYPAFRRSHFRL